MGKLLSKKKKKRKKREKKTFDLRSNKIHTQFFFFEPFELHK